MSTIILIIFILHIKKYYGKWHITTYINVRKDEGLRGSCPKALHKLHDEIANKKP
jgi:hypothetical protein